MNKVKLSILSCSRNIAKYGIFTQKLGTSVGTTLIASTVPPESQKNVQYCIFMAQSKNPISKPCPGMKVLMLHIWNQLTALITK